MLPEGCTANGDGSFTFQTPLPIETDTGEVLINEHSGLFGVWARPIDAWRVNFDMEMASADNSFTRISPRQWQEYRLRTTYKVASWVNLSGSVNILEKRNNVSEVNNLQHNRLYGGSAMFEPSDRISWSWDTTTATISPRSWSALSARTAPAGIAKCPGSTVLSEDLSVYTNKSHYGYFDVMWKPVRRLTTHLGYNITSTTGSALFLNPNAPYRTARLELPPAVWRLRLRHCQRLDRARHIGATTAITKIRVQSRRICLPRGTSAAT